MLVKRESGSGLRSSVYSVSSSSVGAVTTLLVVNTRSNNPVAARTNTGSPVEGRKVMDSDTMLGIHMFGDVQAYVGEESSARKYADAMSKVYGLTPLSNQEL